ncbi:MAG: acetyl-CoA carboxylase biotin carboxyl carrier protein subunit, partial [Bacteroidota bacterium]
TFRTMKKKDDNTKSKLKLLNIDYFKYRTQLTEKFKNRIVYKEKDPRMVLAFIPGTIKKILVKEGDPVKKGDLLLTLEAMKMKNRILSPLDGTVKKVNVKPGKVVPKNSVLVELG